MSWHDATVNSLPPLAWPLTAPPGEVDAGTALPLALALIEARLPPWPRPPPPEGGPSMLLWHAAPAPSAEAAAALLRDASPAVAFLAAEETRPTGGRPDLIPELARRLGGGHVLAVAGLAPLDGDRLAVASLGLISPHVLYKLGLERLPGPPPRGGVGSPVALLAEIEIDGVWVDLAAVRLVAGRGPEDRARQVAALLDRIDLYDRHRPVLIAGDLVTTALGPDAPGAPSAVTAKGLLGPEASEPMFELLGRRGYDWRAANVPGVATGRVGPPEDRRPPAAKRLWFLTRGLVGRAPSIRPAPGDHDALAVRVGPA